MHNSPSTLDKRKKKPRRQVGVTRRPFPARRLMWSLGRRSGISPPTDAVWAPTPCRYPKKKRMIFPVGPGRWLCANLLNVRCWMLLDAWYWWDPGLGGSSLLSPLFFSSTTGLAGFALVFFPELLLMLFGSRVRV